MNTPQLQSQQLQSCNPEEEGLLEKYIEQNRTIMVHSLGVFEFHQKSKMKFDCELSRIGVLMDSILEEVQTLFIQQESKSRGISNKTFIEFNKKIHDLESENEELKQKILLESKNISIILEKQNDIKAHTNKFSIEKKLNLDKVNEELMVKSSKNAYKNYSKRILTVLNILTSLS